MTTTELRLRASDPRSGSPAQYELRLATSATEVAAAGRLRDQVFCAEYGARTPGPPGMDRDIFDDFCDHLIVWHRPAGGNEEAVATYRLFPPQANDSNPRSAGLYSSTEFDLDPLESVLAATVEAGRACVHPDHRGPAPIALLWGGIARYLQMTGSRYLLGCASISLSDGGGNASAFADAARAQWWAPPDRQCSPRQAYRIDGIVRPERAVIPPLLRGYLRLGAQICGAPAWDRTFRTADFLILLDLQRADPRYVRRFLDSNG